MEKSEVQFDEAEQSSTPILEVAPKWKGTEADRHDMQVFGRVQQLRRNFHFGSILGFGCCLISTWEINLTTFGIGLINGGTAGMIYGFIICTAGFSLVYASLAEMASISPTAGGQYHWISEFSPPSCQKYLSYISGWLCFTGWQAAIGSIAFLAGSAIQGLIILYHPDTYVYQAWHGTLLVIGIVLASFFFNSVFATRLPLVEGIVFLVHICGLFAIIITLWTLAPKRSAHAVFTEFTNNGGWSSMGTSFMVGLLPLAGSMSGIDCVMHMAEEVKDSSRTLPRSVMTSLPLNAVLGLLMIITLSFSTPNIDEILASPVGMAGYPFLQIFNNATGSLAATTVLTVIPLISLTGSVIAETATASRQLWAFARDGGVPFSSRVAKVNPRWAIPLNSVLISLIVNLLLPLINIGSTAALNAIFSLSGVSILSSYILCIGSVVSKRLTSEGLPSHRWTLGKYGLAINIAALCFLFPIGIFMFFPPVVPVVPKSMNWGCLMYGVVVVMATVWYVIQGKNVYKAPVQRVKRDA